MFQLIKREAQTRSLGTFEYCTPANAVFTVHVLIGSAQSRAIIGENGNTIRAMREALGLNQSSFRVCGGPGPLIISGTLDQLRDAIKFTWRAIRDVTVPKQ